eukprot:1936434-Rhodomonas_salina.4
MPGTDIVYGGAMSSTDIVYGAIGLRDSMPGTDIAYGATRERGEVGEAVQRGRGRAAGISLRVPGYACTKPCPVLAYPAVLEAYACTTRCPVVT